MPLVTLEDIQISFGPDVLFDGLGVRFHPKEKVGLVGPNGCGKTTLLNIIYGSLEPEAGEVKKRRKLRIGYLPQEPVFSIDKTVFEELHTGAEGVLQLQRELSLAAEKISRSKGGELKNAMKEYDRLGIEFELAGGYAYETRIKEVAAGLGIDEKCYQLKTSELSGGQLSRLGLAKVLLADAQFLLLDEPTNHLDWQGTVWLERFLRGYKQAVLIVSHDRFLLDRLVGKVVEISDKKAHVYPGNYSDYHREKQKRILELERRYRQRLEFVERTRDFIARNKDREGMRKTARGRKKRLNKLLKQRPGFLEKPKREKEFGFTFKGAEAKSKRVDAVVTCRNLTKRFGEMVLFEDLSIEILAGQRLGVIGPNGTGKTTFLKLALGRIEPSAGTVKLKDNLSIGYLDQAGAELNTANTVLEEACPAFVEKNTEKLRSRLGAFLFTGDDVFKQVGDLSGGERSRLALCKLVLSEPELLVLDEPTNHLDIAAAEALEEALQGYQGTIIVVSHDRFFLDRIVDQLLVLGVDESGRNAVGRYEFIFGSYSRYSEILEERASNQSKQEKVGKGPKPKRPKQSRPRKTTPPELRQFNSWSIEKIEKAIIETEEQIELLQERFGNDEIYKNVDKLGELQKEFEEKGRRLDLLYRAYELRIR